MLEVQLQLLLYSASTERPGSEGRAVSKNLLASLVPRLFLPPVFNRLQYVKTEGGRPGRFSHMCDVR